METNLKGRIGQEARKLWNKLPLREIAICATALTAVVGENIILLSHVKQEIAIDLKQDLLKGYVDALMQLEFSRRYPADKYPQGISLKGNDGMYIAKYSDMERLFTRDVPSEYYTSSSSPITQKLSKEGSELRERLTENLESQLKNILGLGVK